MLFNRQQAQISLDKKLTVLDVLIVTALLALFFFYMKNAITNPIFVGNTDPVEYNEQALLFMENTTFIDDHWPVGFTILLGSFYKLFGPDYTLFKLFNILLFVSIPLLLFKNIKHFFRLENDKLFLLIFILFLLFDPEFLFYSSTLYKEVIFVFLTLVSLTIILKISAPGTTLKTSHTMLLGLFLGIAAALNSQINTWFIAPLFAWLFLGSLQPGIKNFLYTARKHLPFFSTFVISLIGLTWLVGLNFERSTGNFHLFPTNGIYILFLQNSPNGCEGVEYTVEKGACVPNFDFLKNTANENGVEFDQLTPFDQSQIKKKYILNYLLSNPVKTFQRIIPFMKYWLFPNLEWSQQRILTHDNYLLGYLWTTFLLAISGLFLSIVQKKIRRGWVHIGVFYFFCTSCYMMAFYLMRYKMYFRLFELILCSYTVYSLCNAIRAKTFANKAHIPLQIPLKYFFVFFLASLFYLGSYFKPLFDLRQETNYNTLIRQLKDMSDSISIKKFNRSVPQHFGLKTTDNSFSVELSPTPGNVVKSGIVELYPSGEILLNNKDLREWTIRESKGIDIGAFAGIDVTKEGFHPIKILSGTKRITFKVFVKNGYILPPTFGQYYINSNVASR